MLNLCTIVQDNILSRHYVGRYVVYKWNAWHVYLHQDDDGDRDGKEEAGMVIG